MSLTLVKAVPAPEMPPSTEQKKRKIVTVPADGTRMLPFPGRAMGPNGPVDISGTHRVMAKIVFPEVTDWKDRGTLAELAEALEKIDGKPGLDRAVNRMKDLWESMFDALMEATKLEGKPISEPVFMTMAAKEGEQIRIERLAISLAPGKDGMGIFLCFPDELTEVTPEMAESMCKCDDCEAKRASDRL